MRPRRTFQVGLRRYNTTGEDAHGNPVEGYDAPVYINVYGIAPTTSSEPEAGRNLVSTGLTLLAPKGTNIGYRDIVVIDGVEWKVVGEVSDWSRGPFDYQPGITVNLERAEG